jgi:hypothetical protein
VRKILEERGHLVAPVQVAVEDQAILAAAEQTGGIIITADKWFVRELFRFPAGHPASLRKAGVVQVPGTWTMARLRLVTYLPVIEVILDLRRAEPDRRFAIDLSRAEIRIREP